MEDYLYNCNHLYTPGSLRRLQCNFNDPYLRILTKGAGCNFDDPYLEILAKGNINIAQEYTEIFFNEG